MSDIIEKLSDEYINEKGTTNIAMGETSEAVKTEFDDGTRLENVESIFFEEKIERGDVSIQVRGTN